MTPLPPHVIDELRTKTDLVALIGHSVELKKAGKEYTASCPFHDDSSPSFYVVPQKGFWTCFGCGAQGDAFDWLKAHEGLSFRAAAKRLADVAGVPLDLEAPAPKGYDPEAEQKRRWEALKARQAEQERAWEEAAVKLRAAWDKATDAPADHPYLEKKGIADAKGLKVHRGQLWVPMKGLEKGAPLMSVQRIGKTGTKRFADGCRAARTRLSVGAEAFRKDGRVYVCEGYATGWAIHHVSGAPVVVAFSAGNLRAVATHLRGAYPDAEIVLAADNDRWTSSHRGPNPGVVHAREAAEAAQALVAIPDFTDLATKPTDYNDLWRLEGAEAVRRWLEPSQAAQAATVAAQEAPSASTPPGPEPDPAPVDLPPAASNGEDPSTWLAESPFRPVGYDSGTYYYLPRGSGQIHPLNAASHKRDSLLALAPLSWWEHHFSGRSGVDWPTAADALIRASEEAGVFRPERLRRRGCWPDGDPKHGRVLIHLGDRLLAPGSRKFVDPPEYLDADGHIYERKPRLAGPSRDVLTLEEAQEILTLFADLLWIEPSSGPLLAGFTAMAPLCGALPWRPHVWVSGSAGSGKTLLCQRLVVPLLGGPRDEGGMCLFFEGGSTEAGIRQELGADALPVVYDEAEKDATGSSSDRRIQSVLALARSASSAGSSRVAKGTTHGTAMTFHVTSMFLLSSIAAGARQEADKTRVTVLRLHGRGTIDPHVRREHWDRYRPRLRGVTPELGRRLMARSLSWLRDGRLAETLGIFRTSATDVLGDARAGDQYGTLWSGSWTLMSDEPPAPDEARALLQDSGLQVYLSQQVPEGRRVLEAMLQQEARVETSSGPRTLMVGELVDAAMPGSVDSNSEVARQWLNRRGIRVEGYAGEAVMLLANRSEWIIRALKDTPYGDDWHDALKGIPGVETNVQPTYFHGGLTSRVVRVPLKVLSGEGEEE